MPEHDHTLCGPSPSTTLSSLAAFCCLQLLSLPLLVVVVVLAA
jgi:hypothetical protein